MTHFSGLPTVTYHLLTRLKRNYTFSPSNYWKRGIINKKQSVLKPLFHTHTHTMDYSSLALPPACTGVDPCNNVACQVAIAETHLITQEEFQGRILDEAGEPKVISAVDMLNIMNGGTCSADVIIFDQNVALSAELNPAPAPEPGKYVAYSYLLFKGILSQGAETFSYYIASGNTGRDVIFQVDFAEQPTRYYDDSQAWP